MDDFNHKVTIPLKTTNIYDIESRMDEIRDIKEWIDALAGWQPDQYSMQYLSLGTVRVWFKDQKHAMLCSLRWS